MNIVDALSSPDLLGGHPFFRTNGLASFAAWLPILKATWGLLLTESETDAFCRWTGLPSYNPPPGGWGTVVLCSGRRARKSTAAAIMAAYSALEAGPQAKGQWVSVVAQGFREGQRNLFQAVATPFEEIPALQRAVTRKTADTIALRSGLQIGVWPCKPTSLRGQACRFVAIDEIAFAASPDGRPVDRELIVAARPSLATVPGSKLVILSSPGSASGALFDLVKEHHGKVGSHVLVFVAPAPELNPDLPADYVEEMKADPEAYETEVLGRFRQGARTLFDGAAIESCTVTGRKDIHPSACPRYRGSDPNFPRGVEFWFDPSGGRHDRAALAGAFKDRETGRLVVVCLRAWPSPHSPADVVAEACEVAQEYGATRIHLDAYGGATFAGLIRNEGLDAKVSGKGASDTLMGLLPIIQSGAIELPDPSASDRARELVSELRSVERRPGGSAGDRAEVPRRNGSHGDLAVCVAGVASLFHVKNKARPRVAPIAVGRRNPHVFYGQTFGKIITPHYEAA